MAEVDTTGPAPTATKYLCDAGGNQLIRRDPTQTTLFAGDTEIVVNTAVTSNVVLGAVRSHTHGGGSSLPVAVRSSLSGGGVKYLFTDDHGTATLAMDVTTQQVARKQYTPFGQTRAGANSTSWPDPTRSFLGKPQDTSTGYTDVGARKYDSALGRFISADPVFEANSPQDWAVTPTPRTTRSPTATRPASKSAPSPTPASTTSSTAPPRSAATRRTSPAAVPTAAAATSSCSIRAAVAARVDRAAVPRRR
ncbi:RHS repeat-associated core domain-containing protein [Streptomyces sp. NPDC005195]|uniref:RHS repeat-associated core domain-containing protein n=1 Tax=Streptomyces sp. NPDC005195 TaxID=3154561 RepID=UPI00339FA459